MRTNVRKVRTVTANGKIMGRPNKYPEGVDRIQRTVHLSAELWNRIDEVAKTAGADGRTIVLEQGMRQLFGMAPLPVRQ